MTRLPEVVNPTRKLYPSDISDAEWEIFKPMLPQPKGFGYPVEVDFREILNGIFYVQRTGCQWEMMPHDLPSYSTVYGYFQKWQRKGVRVEVIERMGEGFEQLPKRWIVEHTFGWLNRFRLKIYFINQL